MPIATTCPNCKALFRLADEMAGKKVKCQKCQDVFVVPKADEKTTTPGVSVARAPKPMVDMEMDAQAAPMASAAPEEDTAVATTPLGKAPPKIPAAEPEDDDEESDKRKTTKPPPIAKKSTPASRPSVKARRPTRDSGSSAGTMAMIAVLAGVGFLGCSGCFAGLGWWAYSSGEKAVPKPFAAADGNRDRDKKADGVKDGFPLDGKKIDGPPFDRKMDDGFNNKDKVFIPPANPIQVVFGLDGTFKSDNVLHPLDQKGERGQPHKLYLLPMQAGKTYQIDMISNHFDSYLFLLDNTNKIVAADDDSGGFPNARIVYRATRSGVHRIQATCFGGLQQQGNFTLIVRRLGGE